MTRISDARRSLEVTVAALPLRCLKLVFAKPNHGVLRQRPCILIRLKQYVRTNAIARLPGSH